MLPWSLTVGKGRSFFPFVYAVSLATNQYLRCRRAKYFESLSLLFSRLMIAFGVSSLLMWALVNNSATIKLYYLYTLAYTAIIIFQVLTPVRASTNYHTNRISSLIGASHAIWPHMPHRLLLLRSLGSLPAAFFTIS